ncbi:MAG: 4Fe-4S dicluster domain-containing protein [Elusimicrobiota bacterium]|jgi:[FeFe] hydrogenase (group B1/B3)|nr:4Fe-4S dicluster domain-containing protein [Elusimicrobiota bacterium]
MKKFDSTIKLIKHKVLTEIARGAFNDSLLTDLPDIPNKIINGRHPSYRCCIFKEKAIVAERTKAAMGGNKSNPNVIEVIDIACDGCPADGYHVSDTCRGCLSHNCLEVCPRNAIAIREDLTSYIDKKKCINCGLCAKVCSFNAIVNFTPPCEAACKIDAITREEDGISKIDNEKCVSCGACMVKCPFGAINDKSFILDVIGMLKKKEKVFAICAPSIAGQFDYASMGQVISGIKKLGFSDVLEVALGADMTADNESKELAQKKLLTSSCCPSFVLFVKKKHPKMVKHISHNLSPMGELAKHLKQKHKDAKVVFIGPCVSKKMEIQLPEVAKYVDSALTYEELQALFESRDIDIETLEGEDFSDASYFGRIFARSGGVSEAVKEALKEHQIDFDIKPAICSGLDECNKALLRVFANKDKVGSENFIEGMACSGGCIGGAGNLHYSPKNKFLVEQHAAKASKNISEMINKAKALE